MQLLGWIHVHLNVTILTQHPSAEVPWQLQESARLGATLQLSCVLPQVLEHHVRVSAIHVDLAHQWESHIELLLRSLLDHVIGVGLLL